MNPRVKAVKPISDYRLILTFENNEIKIFDVKPYLTKGIFRELTDLRVFNSVRPMLGSIAWANGQDFCPDTLYMDSEPLPPSAAIPSALDTLAVHELGGD